MPRVRSTHLDARALASVSLAFLMLACSSARPSPSGSSTPAPSGSNAHRVVVMTLTSPSIRAGRPVPPHNSCRTDDYSPALHWTPGPAGTVEYALIVDDPDVKPHPFVHWTIWDIPVRLRSIGENPPFVTSKLPPGAHQGRNDTGTVGYAGPCFPERARHHYRFTVYALSARPALAQGASPNEMRGRIRTVIVGAGTIIAKGY